MALLTHSSIAAAVAPAGPDGADVAALVIFGCAIVHTFFAARISHYAHRESHGPVARRLLHLAGEIELIFALWVVVLVAVLLPLKGGAAVGAYLAREVSYTEPLFVGVIMLLASARPVLALAERGLRACASLGGGTPAAWWFTLLIVAPLLGSLITEPAAMTIAALLLGRQFFPTRPSPALAYATLGLLFVNVSIGGTLTHFAAPPVVMVASAWGWDLGFMLTTFGWRAVLAIVAATLAMYALHRRELSRPGAASGGPGEDRTPGWIILIHLVLMAVAVWGAHRPVALGACLLGFFAFRAVTAGHQGPLALRGPVLVAVFLGGLVIHGGLQGWWIGPLLARLGELELFAGSVALTAFNDNALITYLASRVPGLTPELQYAVMAGAVTGGGLTVIANAPNPVGQSILGRHFPGGVSPLRLLRGAILPTLIAAACFWVG